LCYIERDIYVAVGAGILPPAQLCRAIKGASNAALTLKSPSLKSWYVRAVYMTIALIASFLFLGAIVGTIKLIAVSQESGGGGHHRPDCHGDDQR
jgi:hypothetical protein